MKSLPPIEKVFEAWSALANNRVILNEENSNEGYADVSSSDGEKSYVVRFKGNQYSSDDNATFWRGYPGYPVIAVLMKQGKLPYNEEEAKLWSNINWTQLNKKHKNNYPAAVEEVAKERNINLQKSYAEAKKVLDDIQKMSLEIKRKIK